MTPPTAFAEELGRPRAMLWLIGALALVMLPHVTRLPAWVVIGVMVFITWRAYCQLRHRPLPGRVVRLALVLLVLVGVTLTYGTPTGRQAGTALLVVLLGLKFLELKTRRDLYLVVFLGYFLVALRFFTSQSIPTALYMLLAVFGLTMALISFQRQQDLDRLNLLDNARRVGLLLLQALPLALLLFVLFPRASGPLWGLPSDAHTALMGMSEEMSPGQISRLLQSDAVAFRAYFDGDLPVAEKRYWRGLLLWDFDGFVWRKGPRLPMRPLELEPRSDPVRYRVILEPTDRHWLFALDFPGAVVSDERGKPPRTHRLRHAGVIPGFGYVTQDFQLFTPKPLTLRHRYEVVSYADYRVTSLTAEQRWLGLRLPPGLDPRIRELVDGWRQPGASDREVLQKALRYFREQPFRYTLAPPLMTENPTAEFLFDTRSGYCEHYASALAVLMRSAGIPARIVTGYLGGEYNPLGNYMIVRQLDAHAWTEVWLAGDGWVRVDPTAAVAPQRIELGLDALPELAITPALLRDNAALLKAWRNMRNLQDAVNAYWNEWVLSYHVARQAQLLALLGMANVGWLAIALAMAAGGALIILLIALLPGWRKHVDPCRQLYDRFCHKLARRGLVRAPHEAPLDFANRVASARPALADSAMEITRMYELLRYRPQRGRQALTVLRRRVRDFRA
jgi:transglutaminase-like putative cysteine protease